MKMVLNFDKKSWILGLCGAKIGVYYLNSLNIFI